MAARIVYEGAAGRGGDLFAGMKIWLSHRVPMRNTFKEQVESNGGVIAKLEKGADVVIVDHARKDCPPGSISWKWIDLSVKNGILEDIEDHRAGPVHGQTREVGSTQPTKKTKTKFTEADDQLLLKMVARAERKGLPILGNAIYKEFAAKYPHHPWQSWMDRWKKYISLRDRTSLPEDVDEEAEEEEEEVEEEEVPEPSPVPTKSRQPRFPAKVLSPSRKTARSPSIPLPRKNHQKPRAKVPTQPRAVSPVISERSHNSARSLQATPFVLTSAGGDVFTNEETKLLFDAYADIMNLSDESVIDAWIAWSIEHPNHTAQEWRNYFKEYIVPTTESRLESKKAAKRAKEMPAPEQAKRREPAPNTSIEIPARPQGSEVKDSQESSGQAIESPAKQVEPEEVLEADGADKRGEAMEDVAFYIRTEAEFEHALLELADSLDLEVDPYPVIGGRTVPLFDLWQAVQLDEFGGYDNVTGRNLWRKVAKKLGFTENLGDAGRDLRACFSEILCDLEEIEQSYREGEDITSSQEQELIADQLRETEGQAENLAEDEDGGEIFYSQDQENEGLLQVEEEQEELLHEEGENDNDLNVIPMSSPQLPSSSTSKGKRRLNDGYRFLDLSHNKRQRIDKGKGKRPLEIPSTPEDVINNTQMSLPAQQPSPLKHLQAVSTSSVPSSPIQEIRPMKMERTKPAGRKNLEPESQNSFHPQYPTRPKDDDEDDDVSSLGSIPGPPKGYAEEQSDAEDDDLLVNQEPPSPPSQPSLRHVSNTTTRGTLHSSNNNNDDSSTQSQNDSESDLLNAWVAKQVSDGFTQDIVLEAIMAATMSPDEAMIALNALADRAGLPADVPGIWTLEDDEALNKRRGNDEYERIRSKHGISRILKRREFKARLREAGEMDGSQ